MGKKKARAAPAPKSVPTTNATPAKENNKKPKPAVADEATPDPSPPPPAPSQAGATPTAKGAEVVSGDIIITLPAPVALLMGLALGLLVGLKAFPPNAAPIPAATFLPSPAAAPEPTCPTCEACAEPNEENEGACEAEATAPCPEEGEQECRMLPAIGPNDLMTRSWEGITEYRNPRFLPVAAAFSPEECNWIVEHASNDLNFKAAKTQEPGSEANTTPNRVSRTAWLPKKHDSWAWVYDRIVRKAFEQNEHFWRYKLPQNFESDLVERIQVGLYDHTEQGHYNWHQDIGIEGMTSKRRLSVILPLTPTANYEGGVLQMQTADAPFDLSTPQGMLLLFPSYMLHRVTAVTKGQRLSLAMWIQEY